MCNAGGPENNGDGFVGLLGNAVLIDAVSVLYVSHIDCGELHFPSHDE